MNKLISVYLDFLRSIAALFVLLHHFRWDKFSGGHFSFLNFGHEAVIIFFILSGFIISYVYNELERGTVTFMLKRLSRLWSVLIPAIILTLDTVGRHFDSSLYVNNVSLLPSLRNIPGTLLFLNEAWTHSYTISTNVVFWSLSYEFWFYLLFLASSLRLSKTMVIFGLILISVIVGYKILLAFPIWLMGAWVFKNRSLGLRCSMWLNLLVFVLTIVLFFAVKYSALKTFFTTTTLFGLPMHFSKNIAYDYLLGVIVSAHLFAASALSQQLQYRQNVDLLKKLVKPVADVSFTMYCMHVPVLYFYTAVFHLDSKSVAQAIGLLVLTLITIFVIGNLVENQRKPLFRVLSRICIPYFRKIQLLLPFRG